MAIEPDRPAGITAISAVFLLAGGYLVLIGSAMLIAPAKLSMTLGTPLLNGLELAGPYMFLLAGAIGGIIGFGVLKFNNWARRLAIFVCLIGMVMLIPAVSAAAVDFRPALIWNGLGVVVRVMIVWYLYQAPVTELFRKR